MNGRITGSFPFQGHRPQMQLVKAEQVHSQALCFPSILASQLKPVKFLLNSHTLLCFMHILLQHYSHTCGLSTGHLLQPKQITVFDRCISSTTVTVRAASDARTLKQNEPCSIDAIDVTFLTHFFTAPHVESYDSSS